MDLPRLAVGAVELAVDPSRFFAKGGMKPIVFSFFIP